MKSTIGSEKENPALRLGIKETFDE